MEPLKISLSPELSEFVDHQVAIGGYGTPSDYISAVLAARRMEIARDELEGLLEEGVTSPSRPVTAEYWQDLKARIAGKGKAS